MNKLIYLDNNATTRIDPRVLEEMLPYLTEEYGNPSSSHHFGLSINKAIELARRQVANLINSSENEIVFTSGATESINLALKGAALASKRQGRHIVTVETEHKAVLDTCSYLESIGFEIAYLPVKADGLIEIEELKKKIRPDTIIVSIMYANNETGIIQPVREIAEITHQLGAVFICDATQAVGKTLVDIEALDVDMMAFSGHKFYGPKGVGVLYVKDLKKNKIGLEALLHGGGHEKGLRSGTLNVPGVVGIGKAAQISSEEMQIDRERIESLRNILESELLKIPGTFINGSIEARMYNVTNICFPGTDANVLIGRMKNLAVSNGSACTAAIFEPSYVLKAMGLNDNDAMSSIRFSLGRFNTEDEIQSTVKMIKELVMLPSHHA